MRSVVPAGSVIRSKTMREAPLGNASCASVSSAICLEMAARLREKYDLKHVDVVPSDPGSQSTTVGIAEAGAAEIERWLDAPQAVRELQALFAELHGQLRRGASGQAADAIVALTRGRAS